LNECIASIFRVEGEVQQETNTKLSWQQAELCGIPCLLGVPATQQLIFFSVKSENKSGDKKMFILNQNPEHTTSPNFDT
jgi:hypothetical protein